MNHSIIFLQVLSWLPTTCAHPKSVSLPTATAATAATIRMSVTNSLSSSQRTPAYVSFPLVLLYFDQLLSVQFNFWLWISLSSSSEFCVCLFSPTLLCWSYSCCALLSLPFFPVSPSYQIYPIAMLALLSSSITEKKPVILHQSVSMCSRTPAPDLWQKEAFPSKPSYAMTLINKPTWSHTYAHTRTHSRVFIS